MYLLNAFTCGVCLAEALASFIDNNIVLGIVNSMLFIANGGLAIVNYINRK